MDNANETQKAQVSSGRVFARLYRAVGEERGARARDALFILWMAGGVLAAVLSLMTSRVLGGMTQAAVDLNPGAVARLLALMAAIYLGRMAAGLLTSYASNRTAEDSLYAIRLRTQKRIAGARYGWLERQGVGDLIEKVNGDVASASAYVAGELPELILIGAQAALSVIFILNINPAAAAAYLIMLPVVWLIQFRTSRPVEKADLLAREAKGAATSQASDALTNVATVRAYGLKDELLSRYGARKMKYFKQTMRAFLIENLSFMPGKLISILPVCALCIIGAGWIFDGRMGVGELVTMITITSPLSEISWKFIYRVNSLRKSAAGARRIFEIWDAPMERSDIGLPIFYEGGEVISFDDVRFSYGDGREVLNGLSFGIREGEVVALAGRSGSGKSTVLKLAAALYQPASGVVRVYGGSTGAAAPSAVRDNMAYITQDTFLFAGSIRENIALAAPGAGDDEVERAAALAGLDFAQNLPQGLDTEVGELGAQLSGGQRQRVAIARAILREAPLILMDEATSSLDNVSEAAINRELGELMRGRTALIVAHRLSSIRRADRILVMDGGRIVEQGDHDSLMAAGGLYAALYASQEEARDEQG